MRTASIQSPDYARKLDGRTALMITPELASAGWDDAEALADLLIKSGADVHATCNHGCTPLAYRADVLKKMMFMIQDTFASCCRRGGKFARY